MECRWERENKELDEWRILYCSSHWHWIQWHSISRIRISHSHRHFIYSRWQPSTTNLERWRSWNILVVSFIRNREVISDTNNQSRKRKDSQKNHNRMEIPSQRVPSGRVISQQWLNGEHLCPERQSRHFH